MRRISGNPNSLERRESVGIEDFEYREPTKEEILADLEQALRDVLAGKTRDVFEFLAELEREDALERELMTAAVKQNDARDGRI